MPSALSFPALNGGACRAPWVIHPGLDVNTPPGSPLDTAVLFLPGLPLLAPLRELPAWARTTRLSSGVRRTCTLPVRLRLSLRFLI